MPFGLTASDSLFWDLVETISYTSVLPTGNVVVSVSNVIATDITRREVASSGGFFDGSERVFVLPAIRMGGIIPKEGDRLTEPDGTTWTLPDTITRPDGGDLWRVVGKKAR